MPRQKNSSARELEKFEAAMLRQPPKIVWVLDKRRRVMVAESVDDPHLDTASRSRRLKGLRDIDIEYLEEIT